MGEAAFLIVDQVNSGDHHADLPVWYEQNELAANHTPDVLCYRKLGVEQVRSTQTQYYKIYNI